MRLSKLAGPWTQTKNGRRIIGPSIQPMFNLKGSGHIIATISCIYFILFFIQFNAREWKGKLLEKKKKKEGDRAFLRSVWNESNK
jgi:hypothetical protein